MKRPVTGKDLMIVNMGPHHPSIELSMIVCVIASTIPGISMNPIIAIAPTYEIERNFAKK